MALDALKWTEHSEFTHQPKHDLESLFYVLITLCTYVDGPGLLRSPIPEADSELSVCLNEWWAEYRPHTLARNKTVLLDCLDEYILQRIRPSYWDDFHQVLKDLRAVLWPEQRTIFMQENVATHQAFLDVLVKAREMYREKEGGEGYPYAPITEKQAGLSGVHKRKEYSGDVSRNATKRRK